MKNYELQTKEMTLDEHRAYADTLCLFVGVDTQNDGLLHAERVEQYSKPSKENCTGCTASFSYCPVRFNDEGKL